MPSTSRIVLAPSTRRWGPSTRYRISATSSTNAEETTTPARMNAHAETQVDSRRCSTYTPATRTSHSHVRAS